MRRGKKRMSERQFLLFLIPPLAILLGTVIALTAVMEHYSYSMDIFFGRGERKIVQSGDTDDWDTDYYEQLFSETTGDHGSRANGAAVTKQITDEGIVLLKNDGILPLAEGSAVTPFGYRYVRPVYGGTGSANTDFLQSYVCTAEEGLEKYYQVNAEVKERLFNSVPVRLTQTSAEPAKPEEGSDEFAEVSTSLYEFDPGVYAGLEDSFAGTTAFVYIGRIGGESKNLPHTPFYNDLAPHALALTEYEKQAIAIAKEHCDAVVIILDTSNTMEIGELTEGDLEADAIVWIGGPGSMGFSSLADILVGKIVPSGRTPDLWERNMLSSPAMQNFDEQLYTNTEDIRIAGNSGRFEQGVFFLEYEEGIYYGYRYYETACVEEKGFVYGATDAEGGCVQAGAVVYPFGYGLSYTSFSQRILSVRETDGTIEVTAEVANTGKSDGKETLQLYCTAPYTETDAELGIEKAGKSLLAFEKVFLSAGECRTVTLSFAKEDMASYCSVHENGDGTRGCYVLEEGEYVLTLGKNSHESWDSDLFSVPATVWYDDDTPRASEVRAQSELDAKGNSLGIPAKAVVDKNAEFVSAHNVFEDSEDYMKTEAVVFSRRDWEGTFPQLSERKALSEARKAECSSFDPLNDPLLGLACEGSVNYAEDAPESRQDNGLVLSDMRGLGYYDEAWESFLDQIDYDEEAVVDMVFGSMFSTAQVECIGKPKTVDLDGSQGIKITGASDVLATCAYCSEVTVAATWNTALARAYGEAIGQECLTLGVNGWYAPAVNIHRTPFCGRNFEYYSEDPLLSGKMAAACISGASESGVVCYLKHLGMNEFEDNAINTCCWATEQTIREIYLRGFEIAVKEAEKTIRYICDSEGTRAEKTVRGCTAVMAAGTLMGATWGAANYALLEEILRGEWGFQGVVTTDNAPQATPNVAYKAIFAGSDLRMNWRSVETDVVSVGAGQWVIRRAVKNICFAYANSNVTDGLAPGATAYYTMSPWRIALLFANIGAGIVVLCGIAAIVLRHFDRKKHPQCYREEGE